MYSGLVIAERVEIRDGTADKYLGREEPKATSEVISREDYQAALCVLPDYVAQKLKIMPPLQTSIPQSGWSLDSVMRIKAARVNQVVGNTFFRPPDFLSHIEMAFDLLAAFQHDLKENDPRDGLNSFNYHMNGIFDDFVFLNISERLQGCKSDDL